MPCSCFCHSSFAVGAAAPPPASPEEGGRASRKRRLSQLCLMPWRRFFMSQPSMAHSAPSSMAAALPLLHGHPPHMLNWQSSVPECVVALGIP